MSKIDPASPEEKSTSKFPLGLTSTLLGFFLLIGSTIVLLLIFLNPEMVLSDSTGQILGSFILLFYFCAAEPVLAVFGIFLGIIGVGKKAAWSWAGIVLNLMALCVIPVLFLLTLTILATA